MKDNFPCPSNLPPGDKISEKIRFSVKLIADLQMSSVYQSLKPWLLNLKESVVEIGSGLQPYRHLIPKSVKYKSLDWDQSDENFGYTAPDTVYYGGGKFPFSNELFQNLFHTEVLEHVFEKELFLRECHRVLKSGGEMLFAIPFQARYHYIPFDYWRLTPASIELLLEKEGFINIKIYPRGNDITVAAYKILSLFYRWILFSGKTGKLIGLLYFPIAFIACIVGNISLRINVGSSDDCLGYVVIAEKAYRKQVRCNE